MGYASAAERRVSGNEIKREELTRESGLVTTDWWRVREQDHLFWGKMNGCIISDIIWGEDLW